MSSVGEILNNHILLFTCLVPHAWCSTVMKDLVFCKKGDKTKTLNKHQFFHLSFDSEILPIEYEWRHQLYREKGGYCCWYIISLTSVYVHLFMFIIKISAKKPSAAWMQVIQFRNTHNIFKLFFVNAFFNQFTQLFYLQSTFDLIMTFVACLLFRKHVNWILPRRIILPAYLLSFVIFFLVICLY